MILGTKARYAVMAMVDMGMKAEGKPLSLASISETQEIPLAYLEQIFMKLKKGGLVKSVRGPGGGYLLARPSENICVADIVMAVDESIKMTRCESHTGTGCMATKARCLTHDLWEGLGDQIHGYLQAMSLKDVCDRKVKGKAGHFPGMNVPDFINVGVN